MWWFIAAMLGSVLGSALGTSLVARRRKPRDISLAVADGRTELVTSPWWGGMRPIAWLLLGLAVVHATQITAGLLRGRASIVGALPLHVGIWLVSVSFAGFLLVRGRRLRASADARTGRLLIRRRFGPRTEMVRVDAFMVERLPPSSVARERWRVVAISASGGQVPASAELIHRKELVEAAQALAATLGVPLRPQ